MPKSRLLGTVPEQPWARSDGARVLVHEPQTGRVGLGRPGTGAVNMWRGWRGLRAERPHDEALEGRLRASRDALQDGRQPVTALP